MSFAQFYSDLNNEIDYDYILEPLLKHLPIKQTVVEAGCGSGHILTSLLKKGYQVIGFDNDPEMLSLANQRLSAANLPVNLYEHDLRKPLQIKCDIIIALFDVVNYFRGIKQVFKNIYQSLNQNGIFIFDIYKEEYLTIMDKYVEEDLLGQQLYSWQVIVKGNQFKSKINYLNQIFVINQYIYSIEYYLRVLNQLGFETSIINGNDDRKYYIKAIKVKE